jgi:hypothetical protein
MILVVNHWKAAIDALASDGLRIQAKPYGFSLILDDGSNSISAECGMDNDFSISLAVTTPEAAPARICASLKPGDAHRRVEWFFRATPMEMANHLITAHKLQTEERMSWIDALRATDKRGD